MLRERLSDALKVAMKSKDRRATSILRLILAAVKDRDIAARGKGNVGGITDDEVLGVLQTMVRQCEESIVLYNKGERPELAEKEAEEIDVIRRFLPEQLDEEQIAQGSPRRWTSWARPTSRIWGAPWRCCAKTMPGEWILPRPARW